MQHERRCSRACGEDVSFRDVKIKIPDRTWGCEWPHASEACAEDLGEFEKSQESWVPGSEYEGWLSLARWSQASGLAVGVARGLGGWKSHYRKNVYLSPYVEKPFNSKARKSFVPELRSRKCLLCFGIPMFYVYMLRTFCVRFTYPYLAMLHACTQ